MRFDIISIFPESFTAYFNVSILKRAEEEKKAKAPAKGEAAPAIEKDKLAEELEKKREHPKLPGFKAHPQEGFYRPFSQEVRGRQRAGLKRIF